MSKAVTYLVIIALASSIVAGAFYYAKRAGKAECVAEYNQKAKEDAEKETERWLNAPRDGYDLSKRLYERAKYKQEARIQRTARYLRSKVVGSSNLSSTEMRDE